MKYTNVKSVAPKGVSSMRGDINIEGKENYDLELDKVIFKIKKENAKLVLLQFPDGLKPYATAVVDYLEEKLNCSERKNKVGFLIWFGDCFGACDVPVLGKELCTTGVPRKIFHEDFYKGQKKIDLVIQFGHNEMMVKLL